MTDTIKIAELINLLRTFIGDTQIVRAAREAADVIEQQAERIAELEARLTAPSIKQLYRAHCSEYEDDYGPALRFDLDGFARAIAASAEKGDKA